MVGPKVKDLKTKMIWNRQRREIDDLKAKLLVLETKLDTLSQQFQAIKQVTNDFTIKVNSKHFSVHKEVLIANSTLFWKLFTDHPELDILELKEISEDTFMKILDFMNSGIQPDKEANMVELFEASCRLEISALTAFVVGHLEEQINQTNALDVLLLCNKFDVNDNLKIKAFTEFQKNFPHQSLIPNLASQPEKLKKLMQAKLEMDKIVLEMHQTE